MNKAYAEQNAIVRQRLFMLAAKLTDADLSLRMANGWSVTTKLAHLAFWHRYYLGLITEWERTGFSVSPAKVAAINEAVRMLSEAIPGKAVIEIVQAAAEAIDRKLEQLGSGLEAAIEASGRVRILCRAMHRREHLDQIEEALVNTNAPDAVR